MTTRRLGLRLLSSVCATALIAPATPVLAAEGRQIEEVIVTAERKESTVSDTSISITAFTGEFIEDFGIRNQEDLQNYIPATVIEPYDMSIRGVGRNFRNLGGDPGIATYLNHVYSEDFGIASTEGGLYDIQRIEVLRGPQGTLYGRNAVGGAINFINNPPQEEFEGEVRTIFADYDTREYYGYVTGNVIDGLLNARVIGSKRVREDGYHEDISGNPDIGNYGDENYSLALQFTPSENIEINIRGNERSYARRVANQGGSIVLSENGGVADEITGLPRNTTALAFGYRPVNTATPCASAIDLTPNCATPGAHVFNFTNPVTGQQITAQRIRPGIDPSVDSEVNYLFGHNLQTVLGDGKNLDSDDLKTDTSGQNDEFFDHQAVSLAFDWDVNDSLSVKYVFGYTDYFYDRTTDEELSSNAVYDEQFWVSQETEYESHELQFFYDIGDRMSFTSGLFYYEAAIRQTGDFYTTTGDPRFTQDANYGPFAPLVAGVINPAVSPAFSSTAVNLDSARNAARALGSPLNTTVALFGPWAGDGGEGDRVRHGPRTQGTNLEYRTGTDRVAYAAYTQGEFVLSDKFELTVGLRWARDELEGEEQVYDYNEDTVNFLGIFGGVLGSPLTLRDYNIAIGALDPATGQPTGNVPVALQNLPVSRSLWRRVERNDEDVTWRVNLDYNVNDDHLVYLSATKGIRSGGFNLVFFSQLATYDPEELIAYELGWKGTLADGSIQVNASAYFYDYENIHTTGDVPSAVNPANTSVSVLPAPGAEVFGLEGDIMWLATERLTLGANASFTPSEYTEDLLIIDPNNPNVPESLVSPADRQLNINGNQLLRVPEFKGSAWAQYNWPLGDMGNLQFSGAYSYIDDVYFTAFEDDLDKAPSYSRFDVRATWTSADENWLVALFVNNVFDEIGIRGIDFTSEEENFMRKVETTDPRLFGIEMRYRFGALR